MKKKKNKKQWRVVICITIVALLFVLFSALALQRGNMHSEKTKKEQKLTEEERTELETQQGVSVTEDGTLEIDLSRVKERER